MYFFKKINPWRILEPILLGTSANILINYIFNPSNPDSDLREFVTAILLSLIITELNNLINNKLDNKYNWTINPKKRFLYSLFYFLIALLFVLNVLGNLYMWLAGYGFYDWDELLIINLITFIVALLLTIFKWTAHFYKKWKTTEMNLNESNQKFSELSSQLDQESKSIKLQKRKSQYDIKVKDIRLAKSEFGVVKVFMLDDSYYIFHGTLSELATLLPEHSFFPVSRNIILHRDMIMSMSSSTYGKVLLQTKSESHGEITVSRPKASTFRKWFNSTSPQKA